MCSSKCQQLHLYAATIVIPAERFQRIPGRYLPPVAIQSRYCTDISSNFITPGDCAHSPTVLLFLYLVDHISAKPAAHRRST